MRPRIIALLITLCAACTGGTETLDAPFVPTAQALYARPAPLPDFLLLATVRESGGIFSTATLCVVINTGVLWRPEETSFTVERRILETTQFVIDNRVIDPDLIYYRSEPNLVTEVTDERGRVIGTYGSPIRSCVPLDDLAPGLHLASVMVTNNSDVTYRHDWTFVIR